MNVFQFKHVGKGLFYSGSIADEYNFVYDCGTACSEQILKNEISVMNLNSKTDKIDFAVLSHLDGDYFCGFPYLLRIFRIDKIYLPYLGNDRELIRFLIFNAVFKDSLKHDSSKPDSSKHDSSKPDSLKSAGEFGAKAELYAFMCKLYDIDIYIDVSLPFRMPEHKRFLGADDADVEFSAEKEKTVIRRYRKLEENKLWTFVFMNKSITKKCFARISEVFSKKFSRYFSDGGSVESGGSVGDISGDSGDNTGNFDGSVGNNTGNFDCGSVGDNTDNFDCGSVGDNIGKKAFDSASFESYLFGQVQTPEGFARLRETYEEILKSVGAPQNLVCNLLIHYPKKPLCKMYLCEYKTVSRSYMQSPIHQIDGTISVLLGDVGVDRMLEEQLYNCGNFSLCGGVLQIPYVSVREERVETVSLTRTFKAFVLAADNGTAFKIGRSVLPSLIMHPNKQIKVATQSTGITYFVE